MYHGRIPEWLGGYPLHWHNEFEIIFITYGEGIIIVQGKKYFCTKDDIIIPPQQIHSIVQEGQKKIAYYNILFDFSFLEENPDSFCSRTFFERFSENTILTTPHEKSNFIYSRKFFATDFHRRSRRINKSLAKSRLNAALKALPIS